MVQIIVLGCESGNKGHRGQKHRASVRGCAWRPACSWLLLESAHPVQIQPPFSEGPAPSSLGPQPGCKHSVLCLECPWGRACRGLELFPGEAPPLHLSPHPPALTHRDHNSESVARPGREQALFISEPAWCTLEPYSRPLSKGLCWARRLSSAGVFIAPGAGSVS